MSLNANPPRASGRSGRPRDSTGELASRSRSADDTPLVLRAIQRDQDAFGELYDRHVNLVCSAAAEPTALYRGERLAAAPPPGPRLGRRTTPGIRT